MPETHDRPPDSPEVRNPLVDAATLATLLDGTAPPVVLDVRWSLAGTDVDAFAAGHIPGAVFVDLDAELAGPPGRQGRHPLPAVEAIGRLLARAGVQPDSRVVVCGERDASIAARAWWLLRWASVPDVRVLDGGFQAWRAAGLPVATGPGSEPGGGTAAVRPGGMPTVDADGAAARGADRRAGLLDARAPERFRGEEEPVDPVAGHIPGAVNVPLAAIHRPDGRLRDSAELREVFGEAGIHDGVPVAASCGSGVTACALVLAGARAGYRFALYPGSYSEWCAQGRPVSLGSARSR